MIDLSTCGTYAQYIFYETREGTFVAKGEPKPKVLQHVDTGQARQSSIDVLNDGRKRPSKHLPNGSRSEIREESDLQLNKMHYHLRTSSIISRVILVPIPPR